MAIGCQRPYPYIYKSSCALSLNVRCFRKQHTKEQETGYDLGIGRFIKTELFAMPKSTVPIINCVEVVVIAVPSTKTFSLDSSQPEFIFKINKIRSSCVQVLYLIMSHEVKLEIPVRDARKMIRMLLRKGGGYETPE